MRKGTSGFALTEKESGAIVIEYVDFVVSEFGGSDYERSYYLDGQIDFVFAARGFLEGNDRGRVWKNFQR